MAQERKKPQPLSSAAEGDTRGSRRKGQAAQRTVDEGQIELLRRQYRSLTGKAAHASVPRFVLARAVAYERQVREHGGLSPRVLSALAAVAKEELGPPGRNITSSEAGSLVASPGIRPGTILVREHQNVVHRVIALETGFSLERKDLREPVSRRPRHYWRAMERPALLRTAREATRAAAEEQQGTG